VADASHGTEVKFQKEKRGRKFLVGIKGLISPSSVAISFPVLPRFTEWKIKVKHEQLKQFFLWPRSIIVLSL